MVRAFCYADSGGLEELTAGAIAPTPLGLRTTKAVHRLLVLRVYRFDYPE